MALPGHAYRDPARIAEDDELHTLGCGGCARAERVLGQYVCTASLKYPACRKVPNKGYKLSRAAGGER
jgi:hypothetical protein